MGLAAGVAGVDGADDAATRPKEAQGGMQQINNAAVGALIAKILEIPVA